MFLAPDPEADNITERRYEGRYRQIKRQTHKHARYEARYARYRNFQYLVLSGEYLRICSCIFLLKSKHAHAPQHARAHRITKRSGEAERSGECGFGGLSDYDAHSTLTRTRKPGAVEKKHYSDCNATQHAHATKQKQWRERERIQTAPGGLDLI